MTIVAQLRLLWQARAAYYRAQEEAGMQGKSLLTSRVFWANILMAALQIGESVGGWQIIPQPWGVLAQSAINIVLRFLTNKPITGITVA